MCVAPPLAALLNSDHSHAIKADLSPSNSYLGTVYTAIAGDPHTKHDAVGVFVLSLVVDG